MKNFLEIVGQSLFENNIQDDPEVQNEVNAALSLLQESYVLVQWPESQELMEEEWFDEETILDVEGKFGGSAYFVPAKRLIK